LSEWNDKIINEFRTNNGVVGGPFAGAHLLLLTTTGAKSGEKRTSPMMYFPDGDLRLVVASKAGADTNPAWYHNLLADPEVHVEASVTGGVEEYDGIASVLPRDERDAAYPRIVELAPGFGGYQEKTDRVIPVVAINRVD
jgi:deazaflavin-dependent oxidoreductase (nitroreductase family)